MLTRADRTSADRAPLSALRVAHLTTVHSRSDIRIRLKQCASLNAAGAEVLLIVADGLGDEPTSNIPIIDVGRSQTRIGRAVAGSWKILRRIISLKPSIIHFHDPELIPLGVAAKAMGFKVIYDVHEDYPRQIRSKDWIPKLLRLPVALAMSAAERAGSIFFDRIIGATPSIASKFPASKRSMVQNFPLSSEFARSERRPTQPPRFTYIGGVTAIRGIAEMHEAARILNQNTDAEIYVAGDFKPASLRADYDDGSLVLLGHLPRAEVSKILHQSTAGLVLFHPLPNHIDAQPNKLFEYMSAALPVIASDFPLWRQIVEKSKCGLLVDPLNPSAIADAMQWMIDHPDEAVRMGKRGEAAVREQFNWDREKEQLIEAYKALKD